MADLARWLGGAKSWVPYLGEAAGCVLQSGRGQMLVAGVGWAPRLLRVTVPFPGKVGQRLCSIVGRGCRLSPWPCGRMCSTAFRCVSGVERGDSALPLGRPVHQQCGQSVAAPLTLPIFPLVSAVHGDAAVSPWPFWDFHNDVLPMDGCSVVSLWDELKSEHWYVLSILMMSQGQRVVDWNTTCPLVAVWSGASKWHPTTVLLPGKSHGRRSLVGCSPWGR